MRLLFLISFILVVTCSCTKEIYLPNDRSPLTLYDEFWTHVNEHYIYFEEKGVDWDSVYQVYAVDITLSTTAEELLQAMENSLLTLRDGHNLIRTGTNDPVIYDFTSGFEIHFSLDLIAERYMSDALTEENGFFYGSIDDQTPYIHIPKMQRIPRLQQLIRRLIRPTTERLILDFRGNGGGDSNDVPTLLGDFVTESTRLGGYIEKSGPAREDETPPVWVYAEPSAGFHFDIEVLVLIDRGCYSATSYFAGMVNALPNFTLVGQITGGGGGGNAGFELSNGWAMAISVSDFIDTAGRSIEEGVVPHVAIKNSADDITNGQDRMLEKALDLR